MTTEEVKKYQKEYRKKNKDKIKAQRLQRMREKALEEIQSIEKVNETKTIITTKSGEKYIV